MQIADIARFSQGDEPSVDPAIWAAITKAVPGARTSVRTHEDFSYGFGIDPERF